MSALVFSVLGMGGSQLYIPLLYWLGMDFKTEAIPLGMLLNLVNSGSAAVIYRRRKWMHVGQDNTFSVMKGGMSTGKNCTISRNQREEINKVRSIKRLKKLSMNGSAP
ncbi:MAG: sulfite exporter TauE/SafE family protein [Anaerolineales bacterium]|nr:sulfite exporter TauE/SafE family protein [Anaerolineales bacterium]